MSDIGMLRQRLTLQRTSPNRSRDLNGQRQVGQVDTIGTYWGSISQISGREAVNADRLKSTASHSIELRYVGNINPATDRFLYHDPKLNVDRIFNVEVAVNVDQRNRYWKIYATEVKNPA